MNKQKLAFTLVELIVTLTILAILGIIAFISLQGYSESSRNSVRIRDISTMKTSLEVFSVNGGKYPDPTGGVDITYKLAQVRNQGTFGEDTRKNVSSLDKIPKDPLTDTEYTYSLLNTKLEYEIGGIMEGGEISQEPKITKEVLALKKANAYIKGTYNGIVAKVSTGGTTYALAIPTIIGTDINELTLEGQLSNKKLAYNGTTNVPSSYGESYSHEGGFDYHSTDVNGIIVYSGALSALGSSGALMQVFIGNLQLAYSGTYATVNPDISNLLSTDLTDTGSTEFVARVLLNQTIDPSVQVTGALSSSAVDGGGDGEEEEPSVPLLTGVTQVKAGGIHTCAIVNGGAKCWGYNYFGELGDGTSENKFVPVDVIGLSSGVVDISVGYFHTCALLDTGGVKCWGYNSNGQLGNGSTTNKLTPTSVTGLESGVEGISLGANHTCALLDTGWIKCWGYNNSGQLGDGSTTNRTTPITVTAISGIEKVVLGQYHTCAIKNGGLKCWGSGNSGALGNGLTTNQSLPVNVTGLSSGVADVSLGLYFTCALLDTGGVKCWGNNSYGQLGNGTTTNSSTPVDVSGLTIGIEQISLGQNYSCALLNTGEMKCWGSNDDGQLGDDTNIYKKTPVDVEGLSGISKISAGGFHICVLTTNGGVKCWGENIYGTMGDGSVYYTKRISPIQSIYSYSVEKYYTSKYEDFSCILTTSGGVKCWGYNSNGQLGNGTKYDSLYPVDVTGLNSGVIDLALGKEHACALLDTGGVKCWGENGDGALGNGGTTDSMLPVNVSTLDSGIAKIYAGQGHTCALSTSGSLKCWGLNNYGQLGIGNTTSQSLPVNVSGMTNLVQDVALSRLHTCAIQNGGVKCWGYNYWGTVGDSSTTTRNSPVNVTGLTSGVEGVSVGLNHSCALLDTGGVKCWGYNSQGQLGNGSTSNTNSPVNVTGLSSGVVNLSVGDDHGCVVINTGLAKCWGTNSNGQIGDGTENIDRLNSVDVVNINSIEEIYGGKTRTCAKKTDGTFWCWGASGNGLFKDGYDFFKKRNVVLGE